MDLSVYAPYFNILYTDDVYLFQPTTTNDHGDNIISWTRQPAIKGGVQEYSGNLAFKEYGMQVDCKKRIFVPPDTVVNVGWGFSSSATAEPELIVKWAPSTGAAKQKLSEGKELVRYFCSPCKPTKTNGGRTRNLPSHDQGKWKRFKSYNLRDVETEMAIAQRLSKFSVPEDEWKNYALDQEINDRGICLDMDMVREAILCDEQFRCAHIEKARNLTGLNNPNSTQQLKGWLEDNGLKVDSLGKTAVNDLLANADGEVEQALQFRKLLAKSSVKKYTAMQNAVCSDGRARGLLQFYGANRTGRFAGRLIQVQNLPQNHMPDLKQARQLVKSGNFEALEMLYDSIPAVLSELIRTAFVPKSECKFIVADFSAIEARVIAWLAGETWRTDVFANAGDIYCASASQMFRVPVEKHGVNGHLRQKGKIAELALGYGGSVGALKAMGALDMGLAEEELQPLVTAWRSANPNIVRLWWDVDKAATTAVRNKTSAQTHGINFTYQSGFLFITLLSGRRLAYVKPRIEQNRFGNDSVTYTGNWVTFTDPSGTNYALGGASGARWATIPIVGTNGVMEVGQFIDFHESNTDTSDYSSRIYSSGGAITTMGNFNCKGQLIASGSTYPQIYGNGTVLQLNLDSSSSANGLVIAGGTIRPPGDAQVNLGGSGHRWATVYAASGTINTSNRNEKNTITSLDADKAAAFISALNPVSFKYNYGTSGRTHYGMISQDVEDAMTSLGMSSLDFAGFIKSPKITEEIGEDADGNPTLTETPIPGEYHYGLRYEEFISPLIKTVQGLLTRCAELERIIKNV